MGNGSTNIGTTPVRAGYYGICHVDVEQDIRKLTGFKDVISYGGYTATEVFEFGEVNGVRFMSTQVSTIAAASGALVSGTGLRGITNVDVYDTFIYGQEAMGTVSLGKSFGTASTEMYNPKVPSAVELIAKPVGSAGAADAYNELGTMAWKAWFCGQILNQGWITKIRSGASLL
jgi:N4-gp56 family major capsid protein